MLEAEYLPNSFLVPGDLVEKEDTERFSLAVGRKRVGSNALNWLVKDINCLQEKEYFWKTILCFVVVVLSGFVEASVKMGRPIPLLAFQGVSRLFGVQKMTAFFW